VGETPHIMSYICNGANGNDIMPTMGCYECGINVICLICYNKS